MMDKYQLISEHANMMFKLEKQSALLTETLELLGVCRNALSILPVDILGIESRYGHPYRDELLSTIDAILAKRKGEL